MKTNNLKVSENKNYEEREEQAPLMLTIDETAQKSGLSAYTIRTWVKKGVIPYVLIGRKYLISWNNFCRFLNSDMGGVA